MLICCHFQLRMPYHPWLWDLFPQSYQDISHFHKISTLFMVIFFFQPLLYKLHPLDFSFFFSNSLPIHTVHIICWKLPHGITTNPAIFSNMQSCNLNNSSLTLFSYSYITTNYKCYQQCNIQKITDNPHLFFGYPPSFLPTISSALLNHIQCISNMSTITSSNRSLSPDFEISSSCYPLNCHHFPPEALSFYAHSVLNGNKALFLLFLSYGHLLTNCSP